MLPGSKIHSPLPAAVLTACNRFSGCLCVVNSSFNLSVPAESKVICEKRCVGLNYRMIFIFAFVHILIITYVLIGSLNIYTA